MDEKKTAVQNIKSYISVDGIGTKCFFAGTEGVLARHKTSLNLFLVRKFNELACEGKE